MAYFDNNSTTRPSPEVVDAVANALQEHWGNPSAPHRSGTRVRVLVEKAREEIAQSLGVLPKQLTFNSGSTESNNTVLSWAAANLERNSSKILISSIEHPSVLEAAKYYFPNKVEQIPVDHNGLVKFAEVEKLINQSQPVLVSLLAAHNETGVIQPWEQVARLCKQKGIWFHCDATQWIGKMDHKGLSQCSSFCFSAHKFGGPKGVGALVASVPMSLIKGGGQEKETRGGTENFPGIEGMRSAWVKHCSFHPTSADHQKWKMKFEDCLLEKLPGSMVIGEDAPRLWNTSLLCLPDFDNLSWVSRLDKLGHKVSTGSACSTAREQPSSLAGAIGLDERQSLRLVRVSSFVDHTKQDWLDLADAFQCAFHELRSESESTGIISF